MVRRNKALGPPIIDRERSDSESDELMLVSYTPALSNKKRKLPDVEEGAEVFFEMVVDHNPLLRAWDEGVDCFLAFVQSHTHHKHNAFDKTRLHIPLAPLAIPTQALVIPSPVVPSSPEEGVVIPSPVMPSSPDCDEVIIPSPVMLSDDDD